MKPNAIQRFSRRFRAVQVFEGFFQQPHVRKTIGICVRFGEVHQPDLVDRGYPQVTDAGGEDFLSRFAAGARPVAESRGLGSRENRLGEDFFKQQ